MALNTLMRSQAQAEKMFMFKITSGYTKNKIGIPTRNKSKAEIKFKNGTITN